MADQNSVTIAPTVIPNTAYSQPQSYNPCSNKRLSTMSGELLKVEQIAEAQAEIVVFPAEAPRVNTNLYVFPETQPTSPQPAVANADSIQNPRQASPVALRPDKKAEALRAAKNICVRSRSDFFTREAMERELLKRPEFSQWGMTITRQEESADLIILSTWSRPCASKSRRLARGSDK